MRGLHAAEQAVVLNALASVSADSMSIEELRTELAGTETAMRLLRDAAPLNGQALRSDFLYYSSIDDSIFAGVTESFTGDNPSYKAAMAGGEYKL